MPTRSRTYWLTEPCRIRREGGSLRIERPDHTPVRIPITDVRDLVAFDHVDLNTSAVSLLGRHGVVLHLLDHYGNYTGSLTPVEDMVSATVLKAQVQLASDGPRRTAVARQLVLAAAANVRWAIGSELLDEPYQHLVAQAETATDPGQLMGVEGNFRRTAWGILDLSLPAWLKLEGRSRRPPRNAGNAFISYVNTVVYARVLTAIRCTPLSPAIGFLHSDTDRRRNTLALDLAEVFKPLFAERLLRRCAAQRSLRANDFETAVGSASLTPEGRKKVAAMLRDEFETTVYHRSLRRKISYDELLHLEALKLVRLCLEDKPYRAFRPWW